MQWHIKLCREVHQLLFLCFLGGFLRPGILHCLHLCVEYVGIDKKTQKNPSNSLCISCYKSTRHVSHTGKSISLVWFLYTVHLISSLFSCIDLYGCMSCVKQLISCRDTWHSGFSFKSWEYFFGKLHWKSSI